MPFFRIFCHLLFIHTICIVEKRLSVRRWNVNNPVETVDNVYFFSRLYIL